ncbi:MAG: response regulator [Candidatus Omnitrophica bacterium]|nr:response regulator [Candidatus Omnitrophota bacterium]
MKILIIEDSLNIVDLFKRFLDNHELHFAYSGKEAIDKRSNIKFDLIFMDNDLGEGLTGEDIAYFHADSINASTPVIVHSSNIVAAPKIVDTIKEFGGQAEWIQKGTKEFFNKLDYINEEGLLTNNGEVVKNINPEQEV